MTWKKSVILVERDRGQEFLSSKPAYKIKAQSTMQNYRSTIDNKENIIEKEVHENILA